MIIFQTNKGLVFREQMYLDLFLFNYYADGMANIDVCYLIWDSIQEDRIVYERIKFPKTATNFTKKSEGNTRYV